jgi:hypothetical protein
MWAASANPANGAVAGDPPATAAVAAKALGRPLPERLDAPAALSADRSVRRVPRSVAAAAVRPSLILAMLSP